MLSLKENKWLIISGLLFALLCFYFIWNENWYFSLLPFALTAVYGAVFHTQTTFLILFFLAPLSINIEEYTDSFGLFIPTEPMLFGIMILVLAQHLIKGVFPNYVFKSPLIWAIVFYLAWIFITSITSSSPITSYKFLLAKLWFLIPVLFLEPLYFRKEKIF